MTQRSCCVPGCSVKLGDGVPLHRFPNPNNPDQLERFRTWIIKIGKNIVGEDNDFIYKNRKVCHNHFESVYTFPNMRLTTLAIPTVQIPGASKHATKHSIFEIPSTSAVEDTNTLNTDVAEQTIKVATNLNIEVPSTIARTSTYITYKERRKLPKPMTAMEKELRLIISETKSKLRKARSINQKLKTQTEMAAKFMKSFAYSSLKDKMTPAARTFFSMQINHFDKRPTGRRFTIDEKILCLSLYKPCPKAYRLLSEICILPKRRTLDKILQKINLLPGINELIFQHLKKRVEKMDNRHKYCSLIFDEMAITPNLTYDKRNDLIHGFVDNGEERDNNFCDHICVFMIRGIMRKYKQPIAFSFCKGSTKSSDLSKQLKNIIRKVADCGLNIVATVCDQGASNVAALNMLINATKEKYLRQQKKFNGGFFEVDSSKIFVVFDPPHLIKGIRNNLLTKNLEFKENGQTKVASWSHIESLYQRGPEYRGVKLVNKLTAQHVIPSLIPKMKVKNCTQVFSDNVGRTMGYMAEIGRLPKENSNTADLLIFFDKLFDSVNGNYHKPQNNKIYRSAVTRRSPHHKLWNHSVPVLKSMVFISKTGKRGVVPSLTSWVKSIEAFFELTKYLHSVGLKSILLRNINQDPLENFFGALRAHGSQNIMPSAHAVINAYKSLLIGNLTSYHSIGANCEKDNTGLLQSLKFLLKEEDLTQLQNDNLLISSEHLSIDNIDSEHLLLSSEKTEKCAAVAYCSGWLISLLRKRIYNDCSACRQKLESEQIQDFHRYICIKERDSTNSWLCYPSRDVIKLFIIIENVVIEILKTSCSMKRIAEYIELIVWMYVDFNFLTCMEHKSRIMDFTIKKTISFFINNWCKEINQIILGKTTFWDERDPVKIAAHNYYIKHKKYKK